MKSNGLGGLKKKWHKSTMSDILRLKLPTPDHEYGFSGPLLKKSLSPDEFKKLGDWMYGQTCMIDEKLGTIMYTHDVIRGIDYIRNGTPTFFD